MYCNVQPSSTSLVEVGDEVKTVVCSFVVGQVNTNECIFVRDDEVDGLDCGEVQRDWRMKHEFGMNNQDSRHA